jgi:preprotein translocase subunit SecF
MKKVINFSKIRFIMFIFSLVIIIGTGLGTLARGQFNVGIDFTGGLNMQVQIAPVTFTLDYEGDGIIEVRLNSGILTLKMRKAGEETRYDLNLQNYETVEQLADDLNRIEGMTVTILKYAKELPEKIISKDEPIQLSRGSGLLFHMPVQSEDEIFASIDAVRSALLPLEDIHVQIIGDELNQEFMLKINTRDYIKAEETTSGQGNPDIDDETGESAAQPEGGVTSETASTDETVILDRTEARVKELLAEQFAQENILVPKSDFVGPSFSQELLTGALWSILLALVLILIYITVRFKIGYAIGAIVALIHDVLIMLGFIGVLQIEVTAATIAAVLTIIGYSLNDTIVVFDRIRENVQLLRELDRESIINTSITQSLSRTIITSLTTLVAVLAIYIFGTGVIKDFALSLIIGILFGTYSSVFIASPILLTWQTIKEKRKKEKQEALYGKKTSTSTISNVPKQIKEQKEKTNKEETEKEGLKPGEQQKKRKKKKKKKKKR